MIIKEIQQYFIHLKNNDFYLLFKKINFYVEICWYEFIFYYRHWIDSKCVLHEYKNDHSWWWYKITLVMECFSCNSDILFAKMKSELDMTYVSHADKKHIKFEY